MQISKYICSLINIKQTNRGRMRELNTAIYVRTYNIEFLFKKKKEKENA